MDKIFALLISAGLIAFGILVIVFGAKPTSGSTSGSTLVWTLLGLMPVVVGLIILLFEIRNDHSAA